ncbi:MAG: hypothetical protein R2741_05265 [Methanolobus sp.]
MHIGTDPYFVVPDVDVNIILADSWKIGGDNDVVILFFNVYKGDIVSISIISDLDVSSPNILLRRSCMRFISSNDPILKP